MTPKRVFNRHGVQVYRGDARKVAQLQEESSFTLAIVDGPYAMGKADWDAMTTPELPEWYRPHLMDIDRLCADSASLYLWNTEEGWATLHPLLLELGWRFRSLIVWDKTVQYLAGKGVEALRSWPPVTEVCGFYQRDNLGTSPGAGAEIAYAAGADPRNWVRDWLIQEWREAGLNNSDANKALGTVGMAGHYFGTSQWCLPTLDSYIKLAEYAQWRAPPRDRPWLVHETLWPLEGVEETWLYLTEQFQPLLDEYEHLRLEYESKRPPFTCPLGISNVWTHQPVQGSKRLRNSKGEVLHACQKPVDFAVRMIEASTRPGDNVWVPFGGTCREAVAAQVIRRRNTANARNVVVCELDQDAHSYLDVVVPVLETEGWTAPKRRPARGVLRKGGGVR